MVEIWVPYGPVEVSFDIKQENLLEILDSQPQRLSQEDYEKRLDSVSAESLLVLSSTASVQRLLDTLLARNKVITKLYYSRSSGALARRKATEFGIQSEAFDFEALEDSGIVDGSPIKIPTSLKRANKMCLVTSAHYDPLFGISGGASDLISQVPSLKSEAFKRSIEELPAPPANSNASWYSIRVLQTCPNIDTIEIVEKRGLVNFFYGDPESVHSQILDQYMKSFAVTYKTKAERIIFGCGGQDSDKTLSEALARAFFNVVSNVSLQNSKMCMLAECSQGLGSEALVRYATGRFTPGAKLDNVQYFDGLEVLISFYKLQGAMELNLLSTLPNYYAKKFDFNPVAGARDCPSSVVQIGSRAKVLVIPDGTCATFSLKEEQETMGESAAAS